jgi:hypothetical protein
MVQRLIDVVDFDPMLEFEEDTLTMDVGRGGGLFVEPTNDTVSSSLALREILDTRDILDFMQLEMIDDVPSAGMSLHETLSPTTVLGNELGDAITLLDVDPGAV